MKIATWNVLHRIHAINWSEPVIANHAGDAGEDARIAAIATRVAALAADHVVALQEVSGDQVAAIRAACGNRVHAAPFPRVPRYRADPAAIPRDPTEFLVIVGNGVQSLEAHSFPTDGGKGLLAAAIDDVLVICTHVTYGDKRPAQLAELARRARAHAGRVVVLGDFNAPVELVLAELGAGFVAAELPDDGLPTRPRTVPSDKSQNIDHVIARGAAIVDARVESADGLSDHNPVRATLT